MNAVSLITIQPVERPEFDNTDLGNFPRWMRANTGLLARYWNQLGQALGLTTDDNEDLDFWLRVQHDIEVSYQTKGRKLPHGGSL